MSDLERVVARLEAAVVAVDATLRVTIWNDAARRLLGFDAGEAIGRSFSGLLSLDATSARGVAAMAALRREGRWSGEATARDRSGAERRIALDASSLAAPDEPWRGAVVALRDAARRDEERRQVAASQRLAAVARIAGGAAHDLNNVLQSVVSCADVLRAQLPADDPRRSWMERIRGAARRGGALTGRLMAFAREGAHAREHVDVNVVAAECVELFRPILEPGIAVALELDPRAGFVFVEPSALTQALANLVLNARDAMPQGGTLTVGTSRRDGGVAERNGRRLALGAGPHVELFVADTGEGIPPEAQERI
ncbi:MAG: PAS domain-containing protein, partial [Candidatus Polarisedimenticolia bacterium]